MSAPGRRGEKEGLSDAWHSLTGKNFLQGLRVLVFVLSVAACIAIAIPPLGNGKLPGLLVIPVELFLLLSMAIKVFALRDFYHKIPWYVVDSILLVALTVLSGWDTVSVVTQSSNSYLAYVCVLSEYYLSAPSLRDDGIMFGVNMGIYTATYAVSAVFNNEIVPAFDTSSRYFIVLIVLVLHFTMFGFAMTVSRKNRKIEQSLSELEESRNELLHAYEKLEEATVLEERNRIAKEIHDTAGHSLTTVIMQTEAARLAIDKDPAEAKRCIAAANLQAKNCLEELRLSVHLLSGRHENLSFGEYLEELLEESANGTGLSVRSKIEDVALTEEAERLIAGALREGISNGVRHGGSTAFLVELKDRGNYVEFLLSDNGCGVDMRQLREGFGLTAMRTKAESLGGMVHYSSEPGEGFELLLSLPASVKRAAEAAKEGSDGHED